MTKIPCRLPVYPYDDNKYIGSVTQSGRSSVNFTAAPGPDGTLGVNVGEFVVVRCDPFAIFGQLVDLKAPEGGAANQAPVGSVQLLTTIQVENANVCPGVQRSPHIGAKIFAAHPQLVQLIIESRYKVSQKDGGPILLSIGQLPDAEDTPLAFTPESLFGRHLAILGTTGGGKSWSLARLVEECAQHKSKVILFDASGEFHTLSRGTRHIYLGHDPNPLELSKEVVVPYNHLTENDLFAIFKPAGQSQAPKLRSAMRSLKLAKLATHLAPEGVIIKAHKSKVLFEEEHQRFLGEIEKPTADFEVKHLAKQIQNECVNPHRSLTEPLVWGGPNSNDHSACIPLINRIQDIIQSPNLAPVFQPKKKTSLFNEIHDFLDDDSTQILRISLKYLAFDHNAREIVTNAVGRHLLQLARAGRFRPRPLLVMLDEAHHFLNKTLGDKDLPYPLDSFALIAKEGRKYSINICLSTQRPRDIPEGVLSQMGTLLVHRLINDRDRGVIERASGELDRSAEATIPILTPGEAIILGVDFPIPLSIRMKAPHSKPDSTGPNYQEAWAKRKRVLVAD